MRSSSGSSLFILLSKLLILKTIKIFKKYYQSIVVMPVMLNVWRRELDKKINKELPEDDLIENRNMLECFLKCFK